MISHLSIAAVFCIATPLFIEFFRMVINRAHHTTLLPPSSSASDLSNLDPLLGKDPADGGLAAFV